MAEIQGRPIRCLINSGCDRSVIGWRCVPSAKLNLSTYELFTANKAPLRVIGDLDIALMVDGHSMEANVSLLPDIEELLLGSNWLIRNQCHWNFTTGTIKMGDLELKTHKRSSVDTSCRVVVAERCVVPPRHEANIAVKVMRVEAETAEPVDWAVEPRELTPGVVAARTLLSNSACVLARVLNYSDLQVISEPDSYFSCAANGGVGDKTRCSVRSR